VISDICDESTADLLQQFEDEKLIIKRNFLSLEKMIGKGLSAPDICDVITAILNKAGSIRLIDLDVLNILSGVSFVRSMLNDTPFTPLF